MLKCTKQQGRNYLTDVESGLVVYVILFLFFQSPSTNASKADWCFAIGY